MRASLDLLSLKLLEPHFDREVRPDDDAGRHCPHEQPDHLLCAGEIRGRPATVAPNTTTSLWRLFASNNDQAACSEH